MLAASLLCAAITTFAARPAPAASSALWIADYINDQVVEYLPSQLRMSETNPAAILIPMSSPPYGVCFDRSHNLWVVDSSNEILRYSAADLKKLPHPPSPTVTITSSSFSSIVGCTFDRHGNLWVVDLLSNSLDEISAAQIKAGSANITPTIVITDSADMSSAAPGFITFDRAGNLWTDGRDDGELFEFSASQLKTSGDKPAAVVLGGGGSLSDPGQIGFDGHGNLWVTSYGVDTLVMFARNQLKTSNDNSPAVTINSSTLNGPWGLVFRGGNLWIVDYGDGSAQEFLPSQLKQSGSPIPKVLLDHAAGAESWGITIGPAFGILE